MERPISTILRCCSKRDVDDLLDAMDVTREARDDHAPLGPLEEQPTQGAADRTLRRGEARLLGVGRIAQQQRDALVAEGRESRDVGAATVDGREVEFEVTRVHDDADVGAKGQRVRARHRVGDRDELDLEGPDACDARRRSPR